MPPPHPSVRTVVLGLAACLWVTGCSEKQRTQPESERNLQALSVLFGRYASQNRGQGPPNEAEFKKFIRSLPAGQLEGVGVQGGDIDRLFVSPRDQQPYGIAWKSMIGVPGPEGQAGMAIWEQTGVGGKRLVASGLGRIEEIDEATFQQRLQAVPKGK